MIVTTVDGRHWRAVFMDYVQRGYFSAFARDLRQQGYQPWQIRDIHLAIREDWVRELRQRYPQLAIAGLRPDGETLDARTDCLRDKVPWLRRLILGDHGCYLELDRLPPGSTYVRQHIQYDAWNWEGTKVYAQTKSVNYAEYRPGLFYIALEDAMLRHGDACV